MIEDAPKPKPQNPRENPCPICGKMDYRWGQMITSNDPPDQRIFFRPEGTTRDDGDMGLFGRICNRCGNVQMFYE